MVRTSDGFEIAEEDLKLRGPGDLLGTQQSGILDLKLADLVKDNSILLYARQIAIEILDEDPALTLTKNKNIASAYQDHMRNRWQWSRIS